MTNIAILPVTTEQGDTTYRAVAGSKQSSGATAGAALDALTEQLPADEIRTVIIIHSLRPDRFFNANQQERLEHLMQLWRSARDHGTTLSAAEQAELEALVDAELHAATQRAAALADEIGL